MDVFGAQRKLQPGWPATRVPCSNYVTTPADVQQESIPGKIPPMPACLNEAGHFHRGLHFFNRTGPKLVDGRTRQAAQVMRTLTGLWSSARNAGDRRR